MRNLEQLGRNGGKDMGGNKNRVDLMGEWELCLDEKPCRYELPPSEYCLEMKLPGTTAQQGIGNYNTARETGFFTEEYPFEGQIWLRKVVSLTEEQANMRHCFLILERTRMTTLWVNGERIVSEKSLCTPHVYDLSGHLAKEMELVICVKNTDYPTRGGHMTSPDTQTNWIGITGVVVLEFHEEVYLSGLRVFSDAVERRVTLKGLLHGAKAAWLRAEFSWKDELNAEPAGEDDLNAESSWKAAAIGYCDGESISGDDAETFSVDFTLPKEAPLWSEHTPECITMRIMLCDDPAQNLISAATETSADSEEDETKTPAGSDQYETLSGETYELQFGLRDFKACGDHFEINGHRTMLRGKHDGMVFPLTGAAPTDVPSWEKVLRTMKEWGINHYRFHTCCPPEAAFTAADHVGIYMEPELPFWGTIDAPGGEKYDGEEQAYLIREGLRICESFGNHPSFCMMSLGNELWGNPEHIGTIIDTLRRADPRPLYTQGSNNFQFAPVELPQEDFWTGVRTGIGRLIRGSYADCDKPLGRIQTHAPGADWDYEEYLTEDLRAIPGMDYKMNEGEGVGSESIGSGETAANGSETGGQAAKKGDAEIEIQFGTGVKKVKAAAEQAFYPSIPAVTHEIGQYNVYPDYREIEGYTGPLKARSFEVFRDRLIAAGMEDQAEEFFRCSGLFSRDLYKMELEAAMRSPHLAGFQILDLQDFPGQGTALVGMMNARLENKGFTEPAKWRAFCGDLVPLALFDSYVWERGVKKTIGLAIRCNRPKLNPQLATVCFSCGTQTETCKVEIIGDESGYVWLGQWEIVPDQIGKAVLTFALEREGIQNEWQLTVFPERKEGFGVIRTRLTSKNSPVQITDSVSEAKELLKNGARVLLLTGRLDEKKSIKGFYCTDFWNYHMFNSISLSMGRQVPVGTMGLDMDPEHPVAKAMFSEGYSTPQWYMPVTHCDLAVLDGMPKGYQPILQMIDNVDRNHRLGLLYEAKVDGGSLLICTVRFEEAPEDPAMIRLFQAITDYAASTEFQPKVRATWEMLGLDYSIK